MQSSAATTNSRGKLLQLGRCQLVSLAVLFLVLFLNYETLWSFRCSQSELLKPHELASVNEYSAIALPFPADAVPAFRSCSTYFVFVLVGDGAPPAAHSTAQVWESIGASALSIFTSQPDSCVDVVVESEAIAEAAPADLGSPPPATANPALRSLSSEQPRVDVRVGNARNASSQYPNCPTAVLLSLQQNALQRRFGKNVVLASYDHFFLRDVTFLFEKFKFDVGYTQPWRSGQIVPSLTYVGEVGATTMAWWSALIADVVEAAGSLRCVTGKSEQMVLQRLVMDQRSQDFYDPQLFRFDTRVLKLMAMMFNNSGAREGVSPLGLCDWLPYAAAHVISGTGSHLVDCRSEALRLLRVVHRSRSS